MDMGTHIFTGRVPFMSYLRLEGERRTSSGRMLEPGSSSHKWWTEGTGGNFPTNDEWPSVNRGGLFYGEGVTVLCVGHSPSNCSSVYKLVRNPIVSRYWGFMHDVADFQIGSYCLHCWVFHSPLSRSILFFVDVSDSVWSTFLLL